VTLGHIRGHGCRDLLVYCVSGRCHHGATINADWLPDETPVRALGRRMVCTRCGMIGADVRPDWGPHAGRLLSPLDLAPHLRGLLLWRLAEPTYLRWDAFRG
jgi:hypothetical protein